MTNKIITSVQNEKYRKGWNRIFGAKRTIGQDELEDKILKAEKIGVLKEHDKNK